MACAPDCRLDFAFDPRILYDPLRQRWIATAGADPQQNTSAILIAVSTNSDPTGGWYACWLVRGHERIRLGGLPDPGLQPRQNRDFVELFPTSCRRHYNGVGFAVLNKTNVYGGSFAVTPQFIYQPYSAGNHHQWHDIQPAAVCTTRTTATLYLLQDFQDNPTNYSLLALYTITGSAGSASSHAARPISPARRLGQAPGRITATSPLQLGIANVPASIRLTHGLSQVVYRNGSLWCAHTIFLPAE